MSEFLNFWVLSQGSQCEHYIVLIKQIKDRVGDAEGDPVGKTHSAGMENWNMRDSVIDRYFKPLSILPRGMS